MKLLLLLTVTLVFWYWTVEGNVTDVTPYVTINEDKCLMSSKIRDFMNWYHNKLRRAVALGQEYLGRKFKKRQMYGLIYDCNAERIARKPVTQLEAYIYHEHYFNLITFGGEYTGNLLDALQTALDTVLKNGKNLRKMINPKSVFFGCYVEDGNFKPYSVRQYYGACVYYKRTKKEKNPRPKGEPCCEDPHCDKISNCTFYKNSKCFSQLCFVMIDGVHVRNLQYSTFVE
ncbi:hypothetical protein Y032_0080g1313 [Ancylostoma ceylanicum]|uniref:SCP domain-containing protein n=1 Tax=Ancylostoma ceylanicum TaxID=53326 RepID=A0A016TRM1_9BILA|nr:hypothetical protein Y032_0080g1313 [Ancylostoma ceylanicum]